MKTPKATTVETSGRRGYLAAMRRFIAAAGRRVAESGDEIELGELIRTLDTARATAIQTAVDGMRERGHSWAYIASATGISREAAYQKWGKK